jgi:hypothetical protein
MTERICEHCGKQFVSELLRDKLKEASLYAVILFLPLESIDCFAKGGIDLLTGLLCLALAACAGYAIYERDKKKKGKLVKFGRRCPSCGERSEDMDSPLGEQLFLNWGLYGNATGQEQVSPHAEEQRASIENPPTISSDGEVPGTAAVHDGSPCE